MGEGEEGKNVSSQRWRQLKLTAKNHGQRLRLNELHYQFYSSCGGAAKARRHPPTPASGQRKNDQVMPSGPRFLRLLPRHSAFYFTLLHQNNGGWAKDLTFPTQQQKPKIFSLSHHRHRGKALVLIGPIDPQIQIEELQWFFPQWALLYWFWLFQTTSTLNLDSSHSELCMWVLSTVVRVGKALSRLSVVVLLLAVVVVVVGAAEAGECSNSCYAEATYTSHQAKTLDHPKYYFRITSLHCQRAQLFHNIVITRLEKEEERSNSF